MLFPAVDATHHSDAQELIRLEAISDQGTFHIVVFWEPSELGKTSAFNITFYDSQTETPLEDIRYDFSVYHENGRLFLNRTLQHSPDQNVLFSETGGYLIQIGNIEGLGEGLSIPIQVTPEFPYSYFVSAIPVVGTVLVIRVAKNLFRSPRSE